MKPDWSDAPSWAKWLAMDSNGTWYWHALKPEPDDTGNGYWLSTGPVREAEGSLGSWSETLQPRP